MPNKHLTSYLNDHLAGATAAVELLDRLIELRIDTDLRSLLTSLRSEVAQDRETLRGIMKAAHVEESGPRQAAGWIADKAAHLKLRAEDPNFGDFYLLESFDALVLGIEGKGALWRALRAAGIDSGSDAANYDRLEARAREQSQRVDAERLKVASAALDGR